jgi:hypothetical protein
MDLLNVLWDWGELKPAAFIGSLRLGSVGVLTTHK